MENLLKCPDFTILTSQIKLIYFLLDYDMHKTLFKLDN